MRVGVDLDGVCYDFAGSFIKYMNGIDHKYSIPQNIEEVDKWHFYRDWGMTDEEFVKHCHNGTDDMVIFRQGPQRDNASEAIDFMRSFGNTIHIVTDRSFGTTPQSSEDNTRWWLFSHGIHYDTLTFSADKTCVETDVFIEDKLENYDALESAGVKCYLVDRPWNQDNTKYRKRIKSIQHFATVVGFMSV
jgi:uncharacterized HAD superfamily protein